MDQNFGAPNFQSYEIHSHQEIIGLLRDLQRRKQLVSMQISGNTESALTSILHVDEAHKLVIVDASQDKQLNERIVASKNVTFETFLDHIRIMFSSSHLKPCTHNRLAGLQFAVPRTVVRIQRREFYRVDTPLGSRIRCVITITDETSGKKTLVAMYVQNISAAGVALIDEKKVLDGTPGVIYTNCRIDLPGTPIETGLEVKNARELTLAHGHSVRRLGCMFVDMPKPMLAAIQRYIAKLQRERSRVGLK